VPVSSMTSPLSLSSVSWPELFHPSSSQVLFFIFGTKETESMSKMERSYPNTIGKRPATKH